LLAYTAATCGSQKPESVEILDIRASRPHC
jgi:hypothetical protein